MGGHAHYHERHSMRGHKGYSGRIRNTYLYRLAGLCRKGVKGIMITSIFYGVLMFSLLIAAFSDNEKTAIISGVFAIFNTLILWKLQSGLNRVHRRVDNVERTVTEDDEA